MNTEKIKEISNLIDIIENSQYIRAEKKSILIEVILNDLPSEIVNEVLLKI